MNEKGMKVLRVYPEDKNGSAGVSCYSEEIVRYRFGEWTEPPAGGGPLAVFAERIDALAFCERSLFAALVGGVLHPFPCEFERSKERELWHYWSRPNEILDLNDLPAGTVLADRVKVLRPSKA